MTVARAASVAPPRAARVAKMAPAWANRSDVGTGSSSPRWIQFGEKKNKNEQMSEPRTPVARATAGVSESEHADLDGQLEEDDGIGKALHGTSAHADFGWNRRRKRELQEAVGD